jgi:3-hydroxymyristoyl/3-hydroxydecanoyl-(acyl carrier protein) dehydratase
MTDLPIVAQKATESSLCLVLNIDTELDWFRGHFPGTPVLPGIVQLHWAVVLAKEHFAIVGEPCDILRLKFKSVVVPPIEIELSLSRKNATDIDFACTSSEHQHSEGRLRFVGSNG